MDIIQKLKENNIKILSIIGLSKNCGKTTTLNKIIQILEKENKKVCVTSIGIDGERFDHLFLFEKPKIYLKENFYVVTSIDSIKERDLDFSILKKFGISTSKGDLILIKMEKEGDVELSGPYIGKDLQKVLDELKEYNFDLILIDGAIDRKVSVKYSDGVILQTGLNIMDKKDEIIEETIFYKEIFSLPEICDEKKEKIKRVVELDKNKKLYYIDEESLYISGAFTDSVLEEVKMDKIRKIIVEHPYNIFLSKENFYRLKKFIEFYVLNGIKLLGVSFSSFYQEGFFSLDDEEEIFNLLKDKLKPIEIFDPVKGR